MTKCKIQGQTHHLTTIEIERQDNRRILTVTVNSMTIKQNTSFHWETRKEGYQTLSLHCMMFLNPTYCHRSLSREHMPRHRNFISPEDKRRLVEKYEANEDFLVTAAELGIKRTTAYGIIKKYQGKGHVDDGRVDSGRKRKIQ